MSATIEQADHVALLRGINLGGRHKVPMVELRSLFTDLGFGAVASYIQSGNVVFGSNQAESALVGRLEAALQDRFGFAVPVAVRGTAEFQGALTATPFGDADPARAYITFLAEPVSAAALARLEAAAVEGEQVVALGREVHLNFSDGMAQSKLAAGMAKLIGQDVCTARNLRTCRAIAALLG